MKKENVTLHSGSLEDMSNRFVIAWHKLKQGESVEKNNYTFFDLNSMLKVLSPKRVELLRYVHHHHVKTIKALADGLGRDYKRVYGDVVILVGAHLMVRDAEGLRAPYESVSASVSF